jgi:hypothetical protein
MMKQGFVPAVWVAKALSKALSTVHRMVADGRVDGAYDGRALYVQCDSLIAHYHDSQNPALEDVAKALKVKCLKEAH